MKKKKNPLSIVIIYWLTQIVFWLMVMVFFGAIVANIALQFGVIGKDLQIHTEMPVETSYIQKGSLEILGVLQEVEYVEATGKIHFIDTNPELAKWFGYLLLGVASITLYIFLSFKRFIGNVYRGYIFERFNIRMLKKMAYGLIIFWGFMIIYSRMFYYFVAREIRFEHLEISSNMDSYGFLLLAALFLWVLSHVFLTGVKLQDDQSLTV
jgi:hypothetical protein